MITLCAYENYLEQGFPRACRYFDEDEGYCCSDRPLDLAFFQKAALAYIDDELNFRMHWARSSNKLDCLKNNLDWAARLEPWLEALDQIIDQLIVKPIDEIINESLPIRTWEALLVNPKEDSIMIESHGDYRILEWERLVREYEPDRYLFLETCTSSAKAVILPIRLIAREGYLYWLKNKTNPAPSEEITMATFQTVTLKILEDYLTLRMIWAQSSHEVEDFLRSTGLYEHYSFNTRFYSAIEQIGARIDSFLDGLISDCTWEVWEVQNYDRTGSVKLSRLNDYRIMDYTRLKELENYEQNYQRASTCPDYSGEADSSPY